MSPPINVEKTGNPAKYSEKGGAPLSEGREIRAERMIGMRILLGSLKSRFRGGGLKRVFCKILSFRVDICRKNKINYDEMWNPAHKLEGRGPHHCESSRLGLHGAIVVHQSSRVSYPIFASSPRGGGFESQIVFTFACVFHGVAHL